MKLAEMAKKVLREMTSHELQREILNQSIPDEYEFEMVSMYGGSTKVPSIVKRGEFSPYVMFVPSNDGTSIDAFDNTGKKTICLGKSGKEAVELALKFLQ